MNFKYGVKDESFKYTCGVDSSLSEEDYFSRVSISLVSGKNDWVAFQLLVKDDDDFILSTGTAPAFSPYGTLKNIRMDVNVKGIPKENISIHPVDMVEDDDRIYKADILLDDENIHIKSDEIKPIWIEVTFPKDTKAGVYFGKVTLYSHTMFEDETEVGFVDFDITVKDVILPDKEKQKFHLDLWQHLSNIARKHETPLWSDAHFDVIENYVKSLSDLGQKAVTVIASEIPWSGQRCFMVTNYPSDLFEYNMIKVKKEIDGSFSYDYSVVERYVDLCFRYGIDREIEVIGLSGIWEDEKTGYGKVAKDFPDAIRIRYIDKADGKYKYMKSGGEIKAYISALERFFTMKGWIDRVRIAADEPADVELYKEKLEIISECAPSFQFKTAINHAEFIDEFKDRVTDFVPVLTGVCDKWQQIQSMKGNIRGKLLWYVCCHPPVPNTFISSHLLESRFIGIFTEYMGLEGFLRWNYTVWPENPRERISYRYPQWFAGDTNFVYPSRGGRPLLTLRYKNLKRGIEDFELMQMLKSVHPDPNSALEKVWSILFKTRDMQDFHYLKGKKAGELFNLDFNDYQKAKTLLLDEIVKYK